MANHCPNCGNHFGCACSGGSAPRTASDGKQVCSKCLEAYEQTLKARTTHKSNLNETQSKAEFMSRRYK